MAAHPGPASSSKPGLQGHSLCENRREHEVFLSHSGKQKQFVHDLFKEFLNYPRFQFNKPFFDVDDESLRKGEEWIPFLIKAARECKVAVMILTEDFLTSKWPMLELLHFIDARKTTNPDIKLLPVFYGDLSPSHLDDGEYITRLKEKWRKISSSGSTKLRKISLTVESCMEALHILKSFNGIKAGNFASFESLRKEIVKKVFIYLPSGFDPETDPDVAGFDRLCKIISEMFQKLEEGVQCLGLYGMGGSGKTTLCRALCSYFGPSFNHKVYHLQMGSNDCKNSQEKMLKRHKELLRKLFGLSPEEIDRIPGPHKSTLKMRFGEQPVFLAIDDIREDPNSWEEVQNYMSYLCPGSKIIITARSINILKNVGEAIQCERIPNLNEEEAFSLFFKIVAPERKLTSLDENEDQVLRACLQICFFPLEEASGELQVPTEVGHYHPLALRAIAFYFKEQNSKLDSIVECGLELLEKKELLFASDVSDEIIFKVLGIGFRDIDPMAKQLFIDVALYAPRTDDEEEIFNWLVDINQFNPCVICRKLEYLRKMSFLNCEDGESGRTCMNINMHDLYREYAKKLVNQHEDEDSYKNGVYNDHYHHAPPALASSGWRKAPRIRLQSWEDVINVKEWWIVSVIHLVRCETITTFSIGPELVNLRELMIYGCSKLEKLNWTRNIISEQRRGEFKLCFVKLRFNGNLKIVPDFSECSQLRELTISECSSSVEPINLHACSSLQILHIAGKNAPEVRSLRSCLKLGSVKLSWKASHTGLQISNLPSLLELIIAGSSVLPAYHPSHEFMVPHGHSLFHQQYPKETIRYKLTGISELTNLRKLHLTYVPMGCLPEGLRTIGSSLEDLNLRGCLLSEVVDFSDISSLRYLSVAQTNVREIRGISGLKKLKHLDCRFNFRLRTIPDLRPATRLKHVSLDQCPELLAIPRLPPTCCEVPAGSEDDHRKLLAIAAFAKTTKSVIPPPLFALPCVRVTISNLTQHPGVQCDGCTMHPLFGPRYKLRDIRTTYNLCRKCLSNKCHRSDCNFIENSSPGRFRPKGVLQQADYDLCYECFRESGCDERDFFPGIARTIR